MSIDVTTQLAYFRKLSLPDAPDFGERLYQHLSALNQVDATTAQQTNANPFGDPKAPPSVNQLTVTAQNGHFDARITDANTIYRGVQYYLEHADNPNFTNSVKIHLGDSRDWNSFLGNTTRYFKAYSSYSSSQASSPVFHGGTIPKPVSGGGQIGGPNFQPDQGSGTSQPGETNSGPGNVPFRSATGAPPVR